MKLNTLDLILINCLAMAAVLGSPALSQPANNKRAALNAHVNLGNKLLTQRQYEQAVAEYEKCMEIDPTSAVVKENLALAHNNWGISLYGQKKLQEAYSEFQEALSVYPNFSLAKSNIAKLEAAAERLGMQLGKADQRPEPPQEKAADEPPEAAGQSDSQVPGYEKAGPEAKVPTTGGKPANTPPATGKKRIDLKVGVSSGAGAPPPEEPSASPPVPSTTQGVRSQIMAPPSGHAPLAPNGENGVKTYGADPFAGSDQAPTAAAPPATAAPPVAAPPEAAGAPDQKRNAFPEENPTPPTNSAQGTYFYPTQSYTNPGAAAGAVTQPAPQGTDAAGFGAMQNEQPHTQVYEDTAAGTSVKIISRPPVVAPPPAVTASPPPQTVVPQVITAPVATPPPAQSAPATTGTIDEQLTALEMKVYGRKQKSAPIFKRLEKLENDTSGQHGQGTVQERVDALLHAYGL